MAPQKTKPERAYEKPLQVRVTAAQLKLFKMAAEKDGRTLSNWARDRLSKLADQELGRNGR